jgi:hypothetical protein
MTRTLPENSSSAAGPCKRTKGTSDSPRRECPQAFPQQHQREFIKNSGLNSGEFSYEAAVTGTPLTSAGCQGARESIAVAGQIPGLLPRSLKTKPRNTAALQFSNIAAGLAPFSYGSRIQRRGCRSRAEMGIRRLNCDPGPNSAEPEG